MLFWVFDKGLSNCGVISRRIALLFILSHSVVIEWNWMYDSKVKWMMFQGQWASHPLPWHHQQQQELWSRFLAIDDHSPRRGQTQTERKEGDSKERKTSSMFVQHTKYGNEWRVKKKNEDEACKWNGKRTTGVQEKEIKGIKQKEKL